MKILVIDDLAIMRSVIRKVLSEAVPGALIFEASSADRARKCVEQFGPDVVVMDVSIPGEREEGIVREISGTLPGATIVVVSASASPECVRKAVDDGANDYVIKPFKPARLLRAVFEARNKIRQWTGGQHSIGATATTSASS